MSEIAELQELTVSRPTAWARGVAFAELAKLRIVGLVVVVTAVGFCVGAAQAGASVDVSLLIHTLIGTGLVGAAANALNQYLEQDFDALMRRTQDRPLPSGRLGAAEALAFGAAM